MRILADNPSMDFLRREAKDLLAALRESDEMAMLSDAQRTIAEEYGFRTWSDLKSEVDRRREALPEAPEGLAQGAAEAFGLRAVKAPMTPIRYEYMGRRWHLETERGRVMLSPLFDWINDEQAEVAVDLQERARTAGVLSQGPSIRPPRVRQRAAPPTNGPVEPASVPASLGPMSLRLSLGASTSCRQ